MATYVPAKRATELIFYMGLVSQSTGQFQANPTLAAGDVKVSKDGGALANLSTLPTVTPAGSKMVKVTLSGTEMTADNVTLVFSDAAGAEWDDCIVNIQTAANQIDDLATPTNITAGTITTATNVTTVNGLAANVITAASIATGAIDADAIADNAIDAGAIAADAVTEIQSGLSTLTAAGVRTAVGLASANLDTQLSGIQSDADNIQTRLPAALSGDGFIKADMKSIDDELTTGNNATLNLKQLNIINNVGNALVAQSSGGDGSGIRATGNGIGYGMFIQGGATGEALQIYGPGNNAVNINSDTNYGLIIGGENGTYMYSLNSADPALYLDGAGRGLEIYGQSNDGALIQAEAGSNGHGIEILGEGTGKSINAPQDIELSDGTLNLQAIEDEIWDATMADHLTSGTTGAALNGAGAAGDPWGTTLPGAYGAGTAGKIIGDNINATVSSRATQTSVDDLPTNAELATALGTADDAVLAQVALVKTETDKIVSVKAKTDSLTFTTAGQVDANVQAVNDTELTGDGSAIPWGPA
jgi:hypothetical protein